MEPQKAYLVEPTAVTTTGKLQGKSVRTYEVTAKVGPGKYGGSTLNITPTGKVFIIENGEIVSKTTEASLHNKYLGYRDLQIKTSYDSTSSWASCLYTSPEIALAAKCHAIKTGTDTIKKGLEQNLASINTLISKLPDLTIIQENYPEIFI